MNHTTETTATVTIAGRDYTLHLEDTAIDPANGARLYRLTGKRGADGAVIIHTSAAYNGRAIGVGIAALERLNWWDISRALAAIFPECAEAVN